MPSRWYAFAALSDARDATEDLLWPIDRGRWLRLALIALFVGVGGGAPTGGGVGLVVRSVVAASGVHGRAVGARSRVRAPRSVSASRPQLVRAATVVAGRRRERRETAEGDRR